MSVTITKVVGWLKSLFNSKKESILRNPFESSPQQLTSFTILPEETSFTILPRTDVDTVQFKLPPIETSSVTDLPPDGCQDIDQLNHSEKRKLAMDDNKLARKQEFTKLIEEDLQDVKDLFQVYRLPKRDFATFLGWEFYYPDLEDPNVNRCPYRFLEGTIFFAVFEKRGLLAHIPPYEECPSDCKACDLRAINNYNIGKKEPIVAALWPNIRARRIIPYYIVIPETIRGAVIGNVPLYSEPPEFAKEAAKASRKRNATQYEAIDPDPPQKSLWSKIFGK